MAEVDKAKYFQFKSKRSRILYEITALIVAVMVISGLVTFFLVRSSQNDLIDKSVDKMNEMTSNNIVSALDALMYVWMQGGIAEMDLSNFNQSQFLADIAQKKVSDFQKKTCEGMKSLVNCGFFDMEYFFTVLPPSALSKDPFMLVSSDESMIYNWEIPAYLMEAIDAGEPYILMKDGIPELGLEGA